MNGVNSRQPKSPPRNLPRQVPDSLTNALARRRMLDTQQRTFHKDSGSPRPAPYLRPRWPS